MWAAHKNRGQALVELSVFGTIFILILAALINYGLRYLFIVEGHQTAFRRALRIASDPNRGSVSYMLVRDKHIPDPADPFGVGSVLPTVSTATITRTNQMDAQASDVEGLPSMVIQTTQSQQNGVEVAAPPIVTQTAGFRWEIAPRGYFTADEVRKYRLLYSDVMLAKRSGSSMVPITEYKASNNDVAAVRIVDSCSGKVFTYDDCYDQAVKLVNGSTASNSPCMIDCNTFVAANASSDDIGNYNCYNICGSVTLNAPNQVNPDAGGTSLAQYGGPWYAQGWVLHPADASHSSPYYIFPKLDEVFADTHNKQLGVSSYSTEEQTKETTLRKRESSEGMGDQTPQTQTQEMVDWSDTINRPFTQHDNLRTDGSEKRDIYTAGGAVAGSRDTSLGATTTQTYSTTISEHWGEQWTTQK